MRTGGCAERKRREKERKRERESRRWVNKKQVGAEIIGEISKLNQPLINFNEDQPESACECVSVQNPTRTFRGILLICSNHTYIDSVPFLKSFYVPTLCP